MAERRMFAKSVIDSDLFLEMPATTQMLYFHLAMRADDDGFVGNPKRIMRMVGASEDDLRVLIGKQFVVGFETGVIVIRHWKLHNYIQKDRYHETVHRAEKAKLAMDSSGAYMAVDTKCIQDVSSLDTEVRLGKDRLGKVNNTVLTDSSSHSSWDKDYCISLWNSLKQYGVPPIVDIKPTTTRGKLFAKRSKEYTIDDYRTAIENIRGSSFLQGVNDKGWLITFDWFVKPNNFSKVLEGNYAEKNRKSQGDGRNDHIFEMIDRLGLGDD